MPSPPWVKPEPELPKKSRKLALTLSLKEHIMMAAELAGDTVGKTNLWEERGATAYLKHLAMTNSSAFCSLLGKLLPTTIAGDAENPVVVQSEVTDEQRAAAIFSFLNKKKDLTLN